MPPSARCAASSPRPPTWCRGWVGCTGSWRRRPAGRHGSRWWRGSSSTCWLDVTGPPTRPRLPRPGTGSTSPPVGSVAELAADLGWSRRRVLAALRAEFGLSPKQGARVFRFSHAQTLALQHPMAEVAARAGYADQAHLCREWRRLSGRTPGVCRRRLLRRLTGPGTAAPIRPRPRPPPDATVAP
ncbi:helix-turn-helix domain-containing protein [Nocardioides sp.]|uniref:helix-turn-helix domain-containing protein n=1 Tax=Nocardioides sp. TaxID=35761 RepID=UPI003528A8CF